MKNAKYFPFERNKYFYGKLLSVDDFELEQKYGNDKRRTLNRLINGWGVVAGLFVVGVDEETISIEAGLALDNLGREMAVEAPVVKKLSLMEGYNNSFGQEGSDFVYLCMEYDEEETEKVFNIAGKNGASSGEGDMDYNKIKEGCRFYLTEKEPEDLNMSTGKLYENRMVVLQEQDVTITHVMPKYAQAGSIQEFHVVVENRGRKNVSFSYDLILNGFLHKGQQTLKVNFDEMLFERVGNYELTFPLDVMDTMSLAAEIKADEKTLSFKLSGQEYKGKLNYQDKVTVCKGSEIEEMIYSYYGSAMDHILQGGYQQPIYLAKIFIDRIEDGCIIEKIQRVPFDQYVMNHMLSFGLFKKLIKEWNTMDEKEESGGTGTKGEIKDKKSGILMKKGLCSIHTGGSGQRGEKFYSNEITHGLGLGNVTILLAQKKKNDCMIFGSSEIFEAENKTDADAELAACADLTKGTFVIGTRLIANTLDPDIMVEWTAIKDLREAAMKKSDRKIHIKPNVLELEVRQTYYLEAVCENMMDHEVKWSVRDNGGFISEDGMYTAPNVAGVYEVVAQSVAFADVKASIFVVVRE